MTYLLRLDDACETMNFAKWKRVEMILDQYNIKPIVGIIPNNEDEEMKIDAPSDSFWTMMLNWQSKHWELALHGNNHIYNSKNGGINPIHNRSEFAGLPLNLQREKIKKGYQKLVSKSIYPKVFVAPSHTFDHNTIEALKLESSIRIISDTIAFTIYKKEEFVFIPQQIGGVRNIPFSGIFTFCYHPNTMNENDFNHLEQFLSLYSYKFTSFKELNFDNLKAKSILDRLFSFYYFTYRKLFR